MTSSLSALTSSMLPSSTADPAAPSTATPTSGNNGGGQGPTSSPLLFFVALGFGVVFTNLWIIVGVKYCFRYNQRNRRQQQDENGDPIDMVPIPGPRRRRREKKLMTMDEVNERFPLTKYKAWTASRAEEGLPTEGGVAAPSASRAASLRDAEGTIGRKSEETQRPLSTATKVSMEQPSPNPESSREEKKSATEPSVPAAAPTEATEDKTNKDNKLAPTQTNDTTDEHEMDDEDEQIQTAVPTEMLEHPGDSCAICIDTLEDDDDVRGLTCGHAFHASCLDPWLTSRRACCPLCKADYYVPKPKPEGEAAAGSDPNATGRRTHGHRNQAPPAPVPDAYLRPVGRRPRFLPARLGFFGQNQDQSQRQNANTTQPNQPPAPLVNSQQGVGEVRRFPRLNLPRPNLQAPSFLRRSRPTSAAHNGEPSSSGNTVPAAAPSTTPSQLEAGHQRTT